MCSRCGATAEEPRLAWACSVDRGTRHYFCEQCARANIRAIEDRLDSARW